MLETKVCVMCEKEVIVHNCHYKCENCGFAENCHDIPHIVKELPKADKNNQ